MSLNLFFTTCRGGIVDFPVQTPTALTLAVLEANDVETRLRLIDGALHSWGWEDAETTAMLARIEAMLEDGELTLVAI